MAGDPTLGSSPVALYLCRNSSIQERRADAFCVVARSSSHLPELIEKLIPGEELIITPDDQPVAKLTGQPKPTRKRREPGWAKGILHILEEDDEHLKDFEEYMA